AARPMLKVCPLDPLTLPGPAGESPWPGLGWEAFCWWRGLVAYAAVDGRACVGWALAESHPRSVDVLQLRGGPGAVRLLLGRLVRSAGEREVSLVCPEDRQDIAALLGEYGF